MHKEAMIIGYKVCLAS